MKTILIAVTAAAAVALGGWLALNVMDWIIDFADRRIEARR